MTLLFSDSRLPAGGHAHSGGIEQAVAAGIVTDEATLADFLAGRLLTTGVLTAAAAVAVCARCLERSPGGGTPTTADLDEMWAEATAELDARTPSPAQRLASRRQGSGLLRAATAIAPGQVVASLAAFSGDRGTHLPLALGATAASAGIPAPDLATLAAYQAVAGPAAAAVRLLGLTPLRVTKRVADLAPELDRIAAAVQCYATRPLHELPAHAAPVCDLLAEAHLGRTERLFAS
jgi:urease accessory protein